MLKRRRSHATALNPPPPNWWFRYVDDSHACIHRRSVEEFHTHFNSIDPHIQFTYEVEQDGSISFLDTKTTRQPDGSITVSVYRKPTNTDRYLDFNSHHHIQHKRAVARTLLDRASAIPSTNEEKISEAQRVIKTLNANGYPTFINSCKPNTHHNRRPPGDKSTKRNFVVLPYNEGLSERISRLLGKHNIKVSQKPVRTVASFSKKPKDPQSKESERGLVYRIDCINCSAAYIGQTSRALKTRKREQLRAIATLDRNSLLAKDTLQTGHDFDLDNILLLKSAPNGTEDYF